MGPVLLRRVQQAFGSLAAAWVAPARELGSVEGIGPQRLSKIAEGRSAIDPAQLLVDWTRKNPCFWTPADPEYPRLLLEIPDFPPLLYYRGQPQPEELTGDRPSIAIVGTRHPTEYGQRWSRKLATILARAGFNIVSGLAEGVDGECHRACLAAGGRTIAVLGTGVDRVYPSHHRSLYGQIVGLPDQVGSGFALSEYPSGTGPDRAHFPRRNRIVAGISRATIVIEGGLKSGALITAHQAADYGRDVYVLPGSLDMPQSEGCLKLIGSGAQVILSAEQLLESLGSLPPLDRPAEATAAASPDRPASPVVLAASPAPTAPPPDLSPNASKVLAAIDPTPTSLDAIVAESGLLPGNVMAALTELEILGLALSLPGMRYQRS
jgi:DNA processing protein